MARKTAHLPKNPLDSVALIGTAGFIGKQLLARLEEHPKVGNLISIDRKAPELQTKKSRFYTLDLTETLADARLSELFKKEKIQTVIHAALPITPPRNPSLVHEIISVGSMYVAHACADANVKKLVFASGTDVYGAFPNNPNYLTEEHAPRAKIPFLADKIDAERSVLRLAQKQKGCEVVIVRPCSILGPTVQSYKTRYLARPFILTILGYDPLVQFIHETDVIDGFMAAIEGAASGIFNLVAPGVLPLSRVIKILGKPELPLPEFIAKNLVQMLWYANLAPAPASYLNFLKYMCVADGEKAYRVLGFKPKFSTREALISFVEAQRLREVALDGSDVQNSSEPEIQTF